MYKLLKSLWMPVTKRHVDVCNGTVPSVRVCAWEAHLRCFSVVSVSIHGPEQLTFLG